MKQYNFRTSDESVIDYLKEGNKSQKIVSALKTQIEAPKEKKPLKTVKISRKPLKVLTI